MQAKCRVRGGVVQHQGAKDTKGPSAREALIRNGIDRVRGRGWFARRCAQKKLGVLVSWW
jgi:hypothetical protein